MKTCARCQEEKSLENFKFYANRYFSYCIECNKAACREYKNKNRQALNERRRQKYSLNIDESREYQREKYQDNIEKKRDQAKKYYWNNLEKVKATQKKNRKKKYDSDPIYRLEMNLTKRIRESIKNAQTSKHTRRTRDLLGCSPLECRNYLESLFVDGMSWENYGIKGWHIDHIKPISSFNLKDPEEQLKCFHYTNLQPLWAHDNIRKSNKY
jgi:hypothetical protein